MDPVPLYDQNVRDPDTLQSWFIDGNPHINLMEMFLQIFTLICYRHTHTHTNLDIQLRFILDVGVFDIVQNNSFNYFRCSPKEHWTTHYMKMRFGKRWSSHNVYASRQLWEQREWHRHFRCAREYIASLRFAWFQFHHTFI